MSFKKINLTLLFILRNIKTKAEIINLQRIEIPEIPENALREAILNAMIHKDYFIEGRILVEIFSDRIEIGNPGKLLFDKKELGNVSILRNPIISDCMFRANYVEKIGSGISRIKELVPSVNFQISSNWFRIIFIRSSEKWGEKWGEKLSLNQEKILNCILEDNTISHVNLSKKVGIVETAIESNIKKLKQKGYLKRIGSPKGGHWEILK